MAKKYRTREEQERDSQLNLKQPHIEARVWSADAERDDSGKVVCAHLVATLGYYPRTGTFYWTYGSGEPKYGDEFEVPLSVFLDRAAKYMARGYQVDHAFKYSWEE
jgi:hypothetical protein